MDKNIKIVSRDKCTGCGACFNKCPKNAIVMEYDNEGFLYPKVTDECINCGLCVAVCPAIKEVKFYDTVDDALLKFAVIISKSNGKWVMCKHKERDTYEVCAQPRAINLTGGNPV